ncbi:serine/threonine-protein kinase [Roseiconus lacunae]|uniref:hypothetical protein n=1 Tax=Roseiconus lacunae TaxID=2605694 RepID=UPI001E3C7754|nr:hypothetical protein [Roseiconus lacunae]MCD0460467.1 hypothetical protein [Roseiconus lacunae]
MPIAPTEFWLRLVKSGLTDQHGYKKYADLIAQKFGDQALDATTIANFLIQQGVITKYQGQCLVGEAAPALRLGNFVIRDETPVRPLTHWIPAQTAVTESHSQSRQGFLLRAPLSALDESRRGWLAAHSEIRHPTLQPIELSGGAQAGDDEQIVEIFSPLPTGAPLWSVLKNKSKLSFRKTVRLGIDLAEALSTLHTSDNGGLAHGAVGADHVWVTIKGNAVLLRDPSSPARSPHADLSASWIERIESPARYAAPELADPNVAPSAASDLYSLGCLLLTVYSGRPVFDEATDRDLFAAHNEITPPELQHAIEQGADGDPLLRVIAYAMAKTRDARFDSAATFAAALQRVAELPPSKTNTSATKPAPPAVQAVSNDVSSRDIVSSSDIAGEQNPAPSAPAKPTVSDRPVKAKTPSPPAPEPPRPAQNSSPTPTSETVKAATTAPTEARKQDDRKRANQQRKPPEVDAATSTETTPIPSPGSTAEASTAEASTAEASTAEAASGESPVPAITTTSGPVPTVEPPAVIPEGGTALATESSTATTLRKRRRRKKNRIPILAGIMVLPVTLLGLAIALRGRGPQPNPKPRPNPALASNIPKVGEARRTPEVNDGPERLRGFEIVDNDRLLWVPPYSSDSNAPSLQLLPPGPAVIAKLSLASLVEKTLPIHQAFDIELDLLIEFLSDRAGVPAREIDQCTLAFFPGSMGRPQAAMSVRLIKPTPLSALLKQWKAVETRSGNQVLYADEDLKTAYYIGGGEDGKLDEDANVTDYAVGPLEKIREVADNSGGSIPLPRSMQTLWDRASDETDLVVLATPNFLIADGRELINQSVPELQSALKSWLIPDVAALMIVLDADENACYVELREVPSGGASQATLLSDLREMMRGWPDWADRFLLDTIPDRSWRVLASRLPLMLRFIDEQTRSTIDGPTVVASAYLPTEAAAQVSLATVLAMNTAQGQAADQATSETTAMSMEDLLSRPMSISFLQLSLQFSIDAVADEFRQDLPKGTAMPKLRIVGGDLELNGITQNQQIRGFEKDSVPLRQVLTDVVRAANPDPTATGPKDPKQALIWVVHPTGKPPAESEILITTRDAAAKKNYELPEEFRIEN